VAQSCGGLKKTLHSREELTQTRYKESVMSDASWREELGGLVLTQQIIVGALVAGAVGFLVVASVLLSQGGFEMGDNATMTWAMNLTLALFLAGDLMARLIVPSMIVANARRKIVEGRWSLADGPNQAAALPIIERTGDAGRLMFTHQTKTIVGAALIEGVTFFAIMAYLMTQSTFALAVACIMIAVLALHFPTRNGVFNWIEDQLRRIEEERAFRGE
jgi:hypothetical protein